MLTAICGSVDEDIVHALRRSRQIDLQIKQDYEASREQDRKALKVVILGPADSGKSTLLKQLKILYGDGFQPEDVRAYKKAANDNIVDAAKALVEGMRMLDILPRDPSTLEAMKNIEETTRLCGEQIPLAMLNAIEVLWDDPDVQYVYSRSNEFMIQDTADFFLSNVRKLTRPDYTPTEEDMLLVRKSTTSVIVTPLVVKSQLMHFIDVGGCRSLRLTWAPFLSDDLTCIFFVLSLAAYEQKLAEEESVNRMEDALELFSTIVRNPLLKGVPIMTFMNKKDLFERSIYRNPIEHFYPDFEDTRGNLFKSGISFFREMLRERTDTSRKFFYYVIKAIDSKLMNVILGNVAESLLVQRLKNLGVL